MADNEELIRRLTQCLKVDPEVQLDVANELRAHIEDATAEFRNAGCDETESNAQAAGTLGSPDELAEQIWQANRGRIRIRQMVKWGLRATLFPSAAILMIALFLSSPLKDRLFRNEAPGQWNIDVSGQWKIPDPAMLSQVPEDQRLIITGEPAASNPALSFKAIYDRWPEPVFYANYAAALVGEWSDESPSAERSNLPDDVAAQLCRVNEERTKAVIAALGEGNQIDPGNSMYDILQGSILLLDASAGETGQGDMKVTQPERFQLGLYTLRRALDEGRCTFRRNELLLRRLRLLPPSSSFFQINEQANLTVGIQIPGGRLRSAARCLADYAVQSASQDRRNEALDCLFTLRMLGARLLESSESMIDLLMSWAIRQIGHHAADRVFTSLGMNEQAQAARASISQDKQFFENSFLPRVRDLAWIKGGGTLAGFKLKQEYCIAERLAVHYEYVQGPLLLLVGLLILMCVVSAGIGIVYMIRLRGTSEYPLLLLPSVWQVARILLISAVLPVAIYLTYSWLCPMGSRWISDQWAEDRVLLEQLLTASGMIVLLLALAYSAIRKAALRAGVAAPPPIGFRNRRWSMSVAGLVVLICLAYIVGWYLVVVGILPESWSQAQAPPMLWFALPALAMLWACRECVFLFRKCHRQFRGTVFRSMAPIILVAAIVLAGAFGFAAVRTGRLNSRMAGSGLPGIVDEIKLWGLEGMIHQASQEVDQLRAERHAMLDAVPQGAAGSRPAEAGD